MDCCWGVANLGVIHQNSSIADSVDVADNDVAETMLLESCLTGVDFVANVPLKYWMKCRQAVVPSDRQRPVER